MALSPDYEFLHKLTAQNSARGGGGNWQAGVARPGQMVGNANPVAPSPAQEQPWNLGQGLIDLLSVGTYSVAGIGQKIGENINAISQGDIGGALDLANPLSIFTSAGKGIVDRRTWSENLTDMGMDQPAAAGVGLALDIALDPLWLIPGGAIGAGIKGTAKGISTASAATKTGVKLSPEAVGAAQEAIKGTSLPRLSQNLPLSKTGMTVGEQVQQFFPTGGQASFFENLIEGVKFRNADEYAKWEAERALRKDAKKGLLDEATKIDLQLTAGIFPGIAKGIKHVADEAASPAEKAANEIADVADVEAKAPTIPDNVKDSATDAELPVVPVPDGTTAKSINQMAREAVQPAKAGYMESRGIKAADYDYKAINAAEDANDIALAYERMIDDPTNPEVINAYRKMAEEVTDQYKYMTEDLGIKVEYIKNEPYLGPNGVVNSKLMMDDVVNNKHMYVRDSAADLGSDGRVHPLLSVDENNMFRAVHDYFGHAASGRGFAKDGEEAAWVSHSTMFSPEARKAMTTETRGQNSWVNRYGVDENGNFVKFAPQKAGFLPDQYIALPTDFVEVAKGIEGTNTYIGRVSYALQEFADVFLDAIGMVYSPVKGAKNYSPEDIEKIKTALAKFESAERYGAVTPEARSAIENLDNLIEFIAQPTSRKFASAFERDKNLSILGLLKVAEDAAGVEKIKAQGATARGLAILRQKLDEPIDATDLLENALKAEGRELVIPPAFKPTKWETGQATYGKPPFTEDYFRQYFEGEFSPEGLDIAFGRVKPKNPAEAKRLAAQQQIMWDRVRAKYADILPEIQQKERLAWEAKYSNPDSDVFILMPNGAQIGVGRLPASIPEGALTAQNGHVTTTLGALIENLGKVARQRGSQMGALPATRLEGGVGIVKPQGRKVTTKTKKGETEQYDYTIGETLPEISGTGRKAIGLSADARFVTPEMKKVRAKVKKRGREIELDKYPEDLQVWLIDKLDDIVEGIKKGGVVDKRLMDVDATAARLFDAVPAIKTMSDARQLVLLGPDALKELRKQPKLQYYIKAPTDKWSGRPDPAMIGKKTVQRGARADLGFIARDPDTGIPLSADGLPTSEKAAARQGTAGFDDMGNIMEKGQMADYRILTDEGKLYTGRENQKYAAQIGKGGQQMASLQAGRAAIGAISEAVATGEMRASAEQAKHLTNVLSTLGIKVADSATPSKVFKIFSEQAPKRFEEIVQGIEAAAKNESVVHQLSTVFRMATKEDIALMEALERVNLSELQTRSVRWTQDAMSQVDQSCSLITGTYSVYESVLKGLTR